MLLFQEEIIHLKESQEAASQEPGSDAPNMEVQNTLETLKQQLQAKENELQVNFTTCFC